MVYITACTVTDGSCTVTFSNGQTSTGTVLYTYGPAILVHFPQSKKLIMLNLKYRDFKLLSDGVTIA